MRTFALRRYDVTRTVSRTSVRTIVEYSFGYIGASDKVIDENNRYHWIHKSIIPTYHFQKSLMRLPIPNLDDSCRRYLDAVRAVYPDNTKEYKGTEQLVDDFLKGEGPMLQKELKAYDRQNKHTSYISEPWFDMYLAARDPCPINYNPFMMFSRDPEPAYNDQLVRATNFAVSCARFKRALDLKWLEPEVFHLNPKKSDTPLFRRVCWMFNPWLSWYGAALLFKAYPLDMSQYPSLFGGCRIPQRNKDRLQHNSNSRHFVVAHQGNFYTVELIDQYGLILPADHILASLTHICKNGKSNKADECVGSLTTLDRDSWADIRAEMIATDAKNEHSLTMVEDALFLLCLDDLRSTDPERQMQALLCGDDGRNRWFDKCFQLIVDGNGQATINFEHSWGDGVAILRLMEETMKDTVKKRFVRPGQRPSEFIPTDRYVHKLDWHLNDNVRGKISSAQKSHVEKCKKLDFGIVEHKTLSKESIKSAKMSPDAIMQLGFQMAFHSIYQEFVPTYESCSTAAFLKGRTECIRSATQATREAVLAFANGSSLDKLAPLIRNCSDVHMKLVKEASMGQGFDRHFFGLKHTAQRLGLATNPLFTDSVNQRMNHFVLSTSTLSTDTIYFGGFGPVEQDGFGLGYNVTDEKLGAVAISYKDKRNAKEFCTALDASLDKIRHAIVAK